MSELDDVIRDMRKKFGEEAITTMSQKPLSVPVIPTGSLSIDSALGVGGIPLSRMTMIHGPDGAGKTTLAQHIVAEAQKMDKATAYIDMEHALDRRYMEACGVDTEKMLLSQPNTGADAIDLVCALIPVTGLIVVDSVASLVTAAEPDGEAGDHHMGQLARMMSQNLKRITPILGRSECALLWINQERTDIASYGAPVRAAGGKALKYYVSVVMRIRRTQVLKEKGEEYGMTVKVQIRKNKVAPPFREADVDIIFGKGIDLNSDLVAAAIKSGVIEQAGSWYTYIKEDGEEIRVQGKLPMVNKVQESKELQDEIRNKVLPPQDEDEDEER